MSLFPSAPKMPDPPAPPVMPKERETPERKLGGERNPNDSTRSRRKGRSALRIDRKGPGLGGTGPTGLNIPT